MNRGNFEAGLESLGAFESGRPSGDPEQYRIQNTLGFTGKYQFGEALLIDLGYYKADTFYGAGAATNLWQGTWTAKAQAFGVNSIEDFRNSPEIQETAIRDAFEFNWNIIETTLGYAGKAVDDFIGETLTFNDGGTQKSVTITPFGILAGAHLRGPFGLANLLLSGSVSYDEYGTSILRYVNEYAGYDVPADITGGAVTNPPIDIPTTPTEPVDPVAPDPVIPNSGESSVGTDGVRDVFSFNWGWGQNNVIKNFNSSEDTVDLKKFWLSDSQQVKIFDDSQGNAVIDLKEVNNQTITLEGISKAQLTANNFQGLPDGSTVLNNPPTPPTNPSTIPPTTPSLPTISIDTTSVVEGNSGKSRAFFTIELSSASDRAVTVDYSTVEGSANSRRDFIAKSGTLTFAPGETSKTVAVKVKGDTKIEQSEAFYLDLKNAVNANILDNRGDATIINDDFPTTEPPTTPPTTPSNGQVIKVNENGADVLNFNPATDTIDFGVYSVHSMIITESANGVAFSSPWNNAEQVLVGISLSDLSIENFKSIGNAHLREDVAGALAWSRGEAILEPNTVYVRSHQVGKREVVDFNPATDDISFLYYGGRETLKISDTTEGVEIYTEATNQSLVLRNVKISDLSESNFEFHFTQVREDHLDNQLGFSVGNEQIVGREAILTPGGDGPTMPHNHPDGHNHTPDSMMMMDSTIALGQDMASSLVNEADNDLAADNMGVDGRKDIFGFTWDWNKTTVIDNFDPTQDIIDLRPFNFPEDKSYFTIGNDGSGNAVVSIPSNQQSIILNGVSPEQLQAEENVLSKIDLTNPNGGGNNVPLKPNNLVIEGIDNQGEALQITIDQGQTQFVVDNIAGDNSNFTVATNNPDLIDARFEGDKLIINTTDAGRASIRLEDTTTGDIRYLGVRINTVDGQLPGNPDYVSIGSVSEDTPADLGFWRDFGDGLGNKQIDSRYIYLNNGPLNNPINPDAASWRKEEARLQNFLTNSLKFGMTPTLVWYNIADAGESYVGDLEHIQNQDYMQAYFEDLQYALDETLRIAGDETIKMILEPDFLGYMAQNSGLRPDQISAQTDAVYNAGILKRGEDPDFANNLQGLVQAINYTISKHEANVDFGWQFNLWASPAGGFTNVGIPGTGIVHLTEKLGFEEGKKAIVNEAKAIAQYYMDAGILSNGADFISIDKYGLDGGQQQNAPQDPAKSTWFWNHDLWKNYLLFTQTLHETTNKPVTLWQIPVGHINGSQATNPYDPSGKFEDLANVPTKFEDSAGTFFLGDTFIENNPDRLAYFSQNQWKDAGVTVNGNRVTWKPNIKDAEAAGINNILFGAGVGISTDGVGSPPTDGGWWISQVQEYFENTVDVDFSNNPTVDEILDSTTGTNPTTPSIPTLSIDDVSILEGNSGKSNANFTVELSEASDRAVTVNYATLDNTANSRRDFVAKNGTLTFAPGETSQTIAVEVKGDTQIESTQDFFVQLDNAVNADIFDRQGIGTIVNDDSKPTDPTTPSLPNLSIDDVSILEGDSGKSRANFTVELSAASEESITVNYATVDNTANSRRDFVAKNGTLTFAPGETSKNISVRVKGDTKIEQTENFYVELDGAVNAEIQNNQGVGTIRNDDRAPNTGGNSQPIVGAYYPEWAIYDRNYQVTDLPADKLTHAFYAFAKINDDGKVGVFDSWAATDKRFDGDWNTPKEFAGNFEQLNNVKNENPHLKTLISIGGWTLSGKFSDVALTDASRETFAKSAVEFMTKYGFDGIDIDWEYPVSGGLASNTYRPEDKHNYTLLLGELDEQLQIQEAKDNQDYLLTIASPAGFDKIENYELGAMSQYLDFFNVMTYDYNGAWNNTTGHNAPLYANPNDPSANGSKYNVDYTIQTYLNEGVPADKIVLGAPAYGRTWTGVGSDSNGLFQAASGAGAGTWEKGVIDYNDLYNKVQTDSNYQVYWDDASKVPYVHNAQTGFFSTYENVESMSLKLDYIKQNQLGGTFFWDASSDIRDSNDPNSLIGLAASELGVVTSKV